MAAPTATTSSGLTPLCGSLPNSSFTTSCTLRHARHAADEHDLVDLGRLEPGVLERLLARAVRALDEIVDQALELGARELHRQMLRRPRLRPP